MSLFPPSSLKKINCLFVLSFCFEFVLSFLGCFFVGLFVSFCCCFGREGGVGYFFGGRGVFISIGGRLSFSCNKMSEFLLFIFECYARSQFEMFPRFAMIMNESLVRSAMKL